MTPTVSPLEFAAAVEAIREAPFGYTLEFLRQEIEDAAEACKVHGNGPRMEHLAREVCIWMEEMNRFEASQEAAKKVDWVEA